MGIIILFACLLKLLTELIISGLNGHPKPERRKVTWQSYVVSHLWYNYTELIVVSDP